MGTQKNPKESSELASARNRLASVISRMYDAELPLDVGATKRETPSEESVAEVAHRLGAIDIQLEILRRG